MAFADLMTPGNLLSDHSSTGLVLSSDGVPIFKSSKGSIWPVYLMSTSIPPHKRTLAENLVVASLWFGPTKPNMTLMLEPILSCISAMEKGIIMHQDSSASVVIRVKLVMAIFDLPAKAAATNTKQYNGEFGCFYCLDKGKIYNRARIYSPDEQHILRTSEQIRQWAVESERENIAKFGVKGQSLLSEYLVFPQCIPIDYMHCVLEGVMKQLMKFWFGSSFHSEPYSLRKHLSAINKIILQIRPPNEVKRKPRTLDDMPLYKASEFRAWLLFYGLPVLSLFLPSEYASHFSLLVSAMHLLLSERIMLADLDIAYKMLATFYQNAGDLYTPSVYTINMHSLEHIVAVVRLWGPLWSYSMFTFENLNGYLGKTYHGTYRIVYQMSFQIQLRQTLPDKLKQLSKNESVEVQAYINKILSNNSSSMHQIETNCYAIGTLSMHTLTDEERSVATTCGFTITDSNVTSFSRLMLQNTIYYSKQHSRKRLSRQNTICCYCLSPTGTPCFGEIISFYLSSDSLPFCFVRPFEISKADSPLNSLYPSETGTTSSPSNDAIHFIIHHVKGVQPLICLPLQNIMQKCIYINIPLKGQHIKYIISCPNSYEFH